MYSKTTALHLHFLNNGMEIRTVNHIYTKLLTVTDVFWFPDSFPVLHHSKYREYTYHPYIRSSVTSDFSDNP